MARGGAGTGASIVWVLLALQRWVFANRENRRNLFVLIENHYF